MFFTAADASVEAPAKSPRSAAAAAKGGKNAAAEAPVDPAVAQRVGCTKAVDVVDSVIHSWWKTYGIISVEDPLFAETDITGYRSLKQVLVCVVLFI